MLAVVLFSDILCACSQAQDRKFQRLKDLYNMIDDPEDKRELLNEIKALVRRPQLQFRDAEQAVFGSSWTTTAVLSKRTLFDSDDSDSEPSVDDDGRECHSILEAVYETSGYIVLDNVVKKPDEDEWFEDCVTDMQALYKTNNCVRIMNNKGGRKRDDGKRHILLFSKFKIEKKFPRMKPAPDSDPEILERMWKFFSPMFKLMELKLRSLHLIQAPRRTSEPKLLVTQAGPLSASCSSTFLYPHSRQPSCLPNDQ